MKIALDLDGVLANLHSVNLQRATLDSYKLVFDDEITTRDAFKRLTGRKDYYKRYYLTVWKEYSEHIVPIERDVRVTSRLLGRCGEVDIVSSHDEDDRPFIIKWLKDHDVFYDDLVLHGFSSTKENIEYDAIIDDSPTLPKKVFDVDNPMLVFLYDQPYNKGVPGKYERVVTLRDVHSYYQSRLLKDEM